MNTAAAPCNQYQRLAIRCGLQHLELPVDRVSVMHRDLFARAGVAWHNGENLDTRLEQLTRAQASLLIGMLKERSR